MSTEEETRDKDKESTKKNVGEEDSSGGSSITAPLVNPVTLNLNRFYYGTRSFIGGVNSRLDTWIEKMQSNNNDPEFNISEETIDILMKLRKNDKETFAQLVKLGEDLRRIEKDEERRKMIEDYQAKF